MLGALEDELRPLTGTGSFRGPTNITTCRTCRALLDGHADRPVTTACLIQSKCLDGHPAVRGMAERIFTPDLACARAWDAPMRRRPAEDRATPATHTAPLQKEPGDRISEDLRLTKVMSACPRTRREPPHQPACVQVS
jgi:hypothetical protein